MPKFVVSGTFEDSDHVELTVEADTPRMALLHAEARGVIANGVMPQGAASKPVVVAHQQIAAPRRRLVSWRGIAAGLFAVAMMVLMNIDCTMTQGRPMVFEANAIMLMMLVVAAMR